MPALLYCEVSVNLATGCPSPKGPSAVTSTAPAVAGRVSTTLAWPEESVVTMRLDKVPAGVVKRMLAPARVPQDEPGTSVTDKFRVVPCAPVWPSPVLVRVAAGFPTTI